MTNDEPTETGDPGDETPFHTLSATEMTTEDRLRAAIHEHVAVPSRVIADDPRAILGLAILSLYILMGTFGVLVVPPPETNQAPRLSPPFQNINYVLGTDALGQDLFALIVHATPPMLKMILAGSVFSTSLAVVVGTVSGYKRGFIDRVLMAVNDVVMTIPGLPLIIIIAAIYEPENPYVIGFLLSINAWAGLARAIRSQVLSLRQESYVEASRIMGLSTPFIIREDILPNIMPYVLISFMRSARNVIFASVGLYFLGVLPFTTLNWGVMINLAYRHGALTTLSTIHWVFIPMVVISLLSLGLILFAQGTDRLFNPRVRTRHAED